MMSRILQKLNTHPLFATLFQLRGNPRACVYTEPLWGIPYNLYIPYASIYMAALGLGDYQIGIIATLSAFFQMFGALLGGIVTDKLGRRRTTFIFDIISWSIPSLIWMLAQNFWWFFVAVIFNSMWQVTDNAWSCLLVEDCDKNKLVDVYTWVSVSGLLSVFFAPISSLLVGHFSIIPTMRLLYGITFLMMTSKFIILFCFSTETKQGKKRLEQTKGISVFKLFKGYKKVFFSILHTPATLVALLLKVMINITQMIHSNFFGLYIMRRLQISANFVALFPMVRAAVMLIFILTIQHRINRLKFRPIMLCGALIYLLTYVLLLLADGERFWILIFYILLDAFAYALLIPRNDSILALFVDKQERARTLGLLFVITLGFTSPFGVLIGKLSEWDIRFPFFLNILLFSLIALLVWISRPLKEQDKKSF